VSCYAKHPDKPGVECWHGPGHLGDHGKEDKSWPNLNDPLRIELKRLADENDELRRQLADPRPTTAPASDEPPIGRT